MSNLRIKSELGMLNIPIGASIQTRCPACSKKKLSVTNKDGAGYLYNCFRASCGFKGYLPLHNGTSLVRELPIASGTQRVNRYTKPLFPLDDDAREVLYRKIGFTNYHIEQSGVRLAEPNPWEPARCAFPIYDANKGLKGYVLRSYAPHVRTKALTFMENSEYTRSSWYRRMSPDPQTFADTTIQNCWTAFNSGAVILVEDIPSAVRLSLYSDTIALLGTTLDTRDIKNITDKYRKIVIALDADATVQALRLHRVLGMWRPTYVWELPKDIKDMTEQELRTEIECRWVSTESQLVEIRE